MTSVATRSHDTPSSPSKHVKRKHSLDDIHSEKKHCHDMNHHDDQKHHHNDHHIPHDGITECDANENWNKMSNRIMGKTVAVFLDYDGTLTPIVENPSEAKIKESTRAIVNELSHVDGVYTAIVTGRSINTIHGFMQLPQLHYAGSHGFDIRGPHDTKLHTVAESFLPSLQSVYHSLTTSCSSYPGSLVEDNRFSLSIHYRNVDQSYHQEMEKIVDDAIASHADRLRKTHGKMVWEIRPRVEWHKGKAVEYLMEQMVPKERQPAVPVYLGDDVTDEDAFRTLHEMDPEALTIFVRPPNKIRPTAAHYTLSHPDDVATFLHRLCETLRNDGRNGKVKYEDGIKIKHEEGMNVKHENGEKVKREDGNVKKEDGINAKQEDGNYVKHEHVHHNGNGIKHESHVKDEEEEKQQESHEDENGEENKEDASASNDEPVKAYDIGTHVSWKWGRGQGTGQVKEIYTSRICKIIKNSTITRNASLSNPAYYIEQSNGNHVLKLHSELIVNSQTSRL